MALQVFATDLIGAGVQISLATDDAFVAAGVTIGSNNNAAITSSGDDQSVNLQGTAVGFSAAIALGNGGNTSTGQHLTIGASGYVGSSSTTSAAVQMRGYDHQVDNAGTIHGEYAGIEMRGGASTGGDTSYINNIGLIEAIDFGIFRENGANGGDQRIELNNTGEIRAMADGGYAYYSFAHVALDIIVNSGLMVGDILLGNGVDVYDGKTGRVIGEVLGGDGADQLHGGDYVDVLRGGIGVDLISGGGGADSLFGDNDTDLIGGGDGEDFLNGGAGSDSLSGGAGDDEILGGSEIDTLSGESGHDLIEGGTGADIMDGGAGNDTFTVEDAGDKVTDNGGGIDEVRSTVTFSFINTAQAAGTLENLNLIGSANIHGTGNALANRIEGNAGNNFIHGLGGNDTLLGNDGNDRLWGEVGNDTLNGGNGIDFLYGGLGNDRLTGGALADRFYFDTKPHGSLNRDIITDFQHGVDKIMLENAVFVGTGAGALNPAFFFAGAAAHDANDRIVYNKATGVLSFDADGTGAQAAVAFAQLSTKPVVSAGDFGVI